MGFDSGKPVSGAADAPERRCGQRRFGFPVRLGGRGAWSTLLAVSQLSRRRGRWRGSVHAACVVALLAGHSKADAGDVSSDTQPERAGETRDWLDLWQDESIPAPDEARIDRWAAQRGWQAARRLLEASRRAEINENPRLCLQLVRALHQHSGGPLREEVVAALGEFFQPSNARSQPAQGELRHFVRGSAALALAASQHPRALRLLLVAARAENETDPTATYLARAALEAHPPGAAAKQSLEFLKLSSDRPLAEPHAKGSASADPSEWPPASDPQSGFARALRTLNVASTDATLQSGGWWKGALESGPSPWPLRTLTILSLRHENLIPLLLERAQIALGDAAPVIRAAAAFAFAVHEPDRAAAFLKSTDTAVRVAALRQAHSGILARQARAALRKDVRGPFSISLEAGVSPADLPTRALWAGLAAPTEDAPWRAILAERALGSERTPIGPDASQLTQWFSSDIPRERSAVAWGLGSSNDPAAAGVLVRAYRTEPSPVVRRAIVRALARKKGTGVERQLLEIQQLDPDPLCRAAATNGQRQLWVLQQRYAIALVAPSPPSDKTAAPEVRWSTVAGRPLNLQPDADGFVGVVGLDFFACENEPNPALATEADCRKALAGKHGK